MLLLYGAAPCAIVWCSYAESYNERDGKERASSGYRTNAPTSGEPFEYLLSGIHQMFGRLLRTSLPLQSHLAVHRKKKEMRL